MKNSGSSEQLDADGDTGSEVSSEVSFSYEFAQTEVMMKALGNNGECGENSPTLNFCIAVSIYFCLCFVTNPPFFSCQTPCKQSSSLWRGSMKRRSALLWSVRDKCTNRSCSSSARS